ncbi:hypothetical protein UA08_03838 [Talaromyces atroroseus]|uniref:SnoaL-like domain-containing protein n=1 Tax=Talaromyces atroroseus TaxID=1441469 RepID=A0A225B2B7_TALAT|nr:hypothetical protein UA08_03838 [Talaromyces atroroseus]OKL61386.1 hypothetical protein UA08_03838 [Talaromyces atroroseus]
MTSSQAHTARSVLDAFYKAEREYMSVAPEERNFASIAATLAPNVRMEQTSALPYAGVYLGPSGMQDWTRRMADYFDIVDVQNPEIFERADSDRIVVLSNIHLRVRKSGQEMDFPFCQTFTIDLQRGVIVELRPFYWDVAAISAVKKHSGTRCQGANLAANQGYSLLKLLKPRDMSIRTQINQAIPSSPENLYLQKKKDGTGEERLSLPLGWVMPEKPDDYEALTKEDKLKADRLYESALCHKYYEVLTAKRNPQHYAALKKEKESHNEEIENRDYISQLMEEFQDAGILPINGTVDPEDYDIVQSTSRMQKRKFMSLAEARNRESG